MNFMGILAGKVVDIADPLDIGRVRVRIMALHGPEAVRSDDMLPWACPITLGGGTPDTGSYTPYPLGASVAVFFESGNLNRPIVLGGISKRVTTQQYGREEDGLMGIWGAEEGEVTDLPAEARSGSNTHVVYKSPKGATIAICEENEGEFLRITDRSGQIFEMSSPVGEGYNQENASRRGEKSAVDGTAMSHVSDTSGPSCIRMIDLAGNTIELRSETDGTEDVSRVKISNPVHSSFLEFTKDGITLQSLSGQGVAGGVTMEITETGVKVNGQYLVTEAFVDWLKEHRTKIVLGSSPGSPEPLCPDALADYLVKFEADMNNSGLKTKLSGGA